MPSICSVAECSNTTLTKRLKPELIHHRFPLKTPEVLKKWVIFCRREDKFDPKNGRICSNHFSEDSYERDLQHELLNLPRRKILKVDAVPTIFNSDTPEPPTTERMKRVAKRTKRKVVEECLSDGFVTEKMNEEPELKLSEELEQPTEPMDQSVTFDATVILEDKIGVLEGKIESLNKKLEQKENQIKVLSCENSKLKSKVRSLRTEQCKCSTSKLLTPQQQKRLHGKKVHWKSQDIVRALSVRSVGLKAYETARLYWKLPLPCVRTLQRWAANFSCEEGILLDVLSVMTEQSKTMSIFQKVCSISFDEININSDFIYDQSFDKIRTHSKAQVLMVRGLFDSWKQPFYYEFDKKMDKATLFRVIQSLEAASFEVVSITSDLGQDNRSLWKELEINENKTYFVNPAKNDRCIYVFADAPHMLKLIRNHLLDNGVILTDGTTINKSTFVDLVNADDAEIKLCPNLNLEMINVSGAERMRVRPAAQLLSRRVAALTQKKFPDIPSVSEYICTINDGFDILNSRCPVDKTSAMKSGYGFQIVTQKGALEKLANLMSTSRFYLHGKARRVLLPCQIGFLVSINSLIKLFEDLHQRYGCSYILSSRLNQDPLESFFSTIRSYGGPNQNPSPTEFKYRMRLILLGSHIRAPKGTNVEYEDTENIMCAKLLQKNKLFTGGSSEVEKAVVTPTNTPCILPEEDTSDPDALTYLAGYIAWKIKKNGQGIHGSPTPSRSNSSWISLLSRGGLLTPEPYLVNWIKNCDDCFKALNGGGFLSHSSTKFTERVMIMHPDIPQNVVQEFIRLRLKIRTKFLNVHKRIGKSRVNRLKAKQFAQSQPNLKKPKNPRKTLAVK